jgi:hypothetical protein
MYCFERVYLKDDVIEVLCESELVVVFIKQLFTIAGVEKPFLRHEWII